MADRQVRAHSRESISFPRKATVSVQSTAAVNLKKSAPPSSIDSASISENKNPELSAIIHRFVHRDDCVVELGCTDGQNLRLIAEITGDDGCVIGIESSPDHIHRLRNTPALRRIKNLRLYLSRGDSLPIEPDVADVIICQGLVSPSGSRQAVYREMLRVLRPGGVLVVHDIVVHKLLPPEIADSVAAFASGLAGAIEAESYRRILERLDLRDLQLTHCPSTDLLHQLLIPGAAETAAGRQVAAALNEVRSILPNFISVVRIFARKLSPAGYPS
jgi:SAM-dependent methyltransferase